MPEEEIKLQPNIWKQRLFKPHHVEIVKIFARTSPVPETAGQCHLTVLFYFPSELPFLQRINTIATRFRMLPKKASCTGPITYKQVMNIL